MGSRYLDSDGVQTADRQMQPDQSALDASIQFDEFDDKIMHDTLGNDRLAKPVQALLLTLRDIKAIQGSFGTACLDHAKLLANVVHRLEVLREACKDEWEDIR